MKADAIYLYPNNDWLKQLLFTWSSKSFCGPKQRPLYLHWHLRSFIEMLMLIACILPNLKTTC